MNALRALPFLLLLLQTATISNSACLSETFNFTLVQVCNVKCIVQQINKCVSKENVARDITSLKIMEKTNKLRRGAFKDLQNLMDITAYNIGLTEIQPNAFINLPAFKTLIASNNAIQEVIYGVFNGLPLKSLGLSNNSIETIDQEAFANMPKLVFLNINFNKLRRLDPNWFGLDSRLETLYASYNQITSLSLYNFKNFKYLRHLTLRSNRIKRIEAKVFYTKRSFVALDLAHNGMDFITPDGFEAGTNISDFNLSLNKFKFLPDLFGRVNAKQVALQPNPWLCPCLSEIEGSISKMGGVLVNPFDDVEIVWSDSYPVCLVVESSSRIECNQGFVDKVKDDLIFKNYYDKLKYDKILLV